MPATEKQVLRELVKEMKSAYAQGRNAMQVAREAGASAQAPNSTTTTLIAYDLQAGNYVQFARDHAALVAAWTEQVAGILEPHLGHGETLMEVGSGEATTLSGVLRLLEHKQPSALGFDLSWSRTAVARQWLEEQNVAARLFVADLFAIPLADDSVDVVYTSHSLEPNGGRELQAVKELLRVARKKVVLCEPLYEFAEPAAQARMREHGYVRGLPAACRQPGTRIAREGLLPFAVNPLNPSGVVVIEKEAPADAAPRELFRCPITGAPLQDRGDAFFSSEVGLAYPVLRGIPLLRPEHAVVASALAAVGE